MTHKRPAPSEYDSYYARYIGRVPDGPVVETLSMQGKTFNVFLRELPEEMASHRYAPGKWTVAEVLGHVIDAERVFGYRAVHFARGASGAIPGMDQDEWASTAPYSSRSLSSMVEELYLLRGSNVRQFEAFDTQVLDRTGMASGCVFSVRSLLYIMAGHEAHHMAILRERYLSDTA